LPSGQAKREGYTMDDSSIKDFITYDYGEAKDLAKGILNASIGYIGWHNNMFRKNCEFSNSLHATKTFSYC
jgi:hypothetical protein